MNSNCFASVCMRSASKTVLKQNGHSLACYSQEQARCIVFRLCLLMVGHFPDFFPFYLQLLKASGIRMVAHFSASFWCNQHFMKKEHGSDNPACSIQQHPNRFSGCMSRQGIHTFGVASGSQMLPGIILRTLCLPVLRA